MTTQQQPWYVRWYGDPSSAAVPGPDPEQQFRNLYPESLWNSMTGVQRAQARAAWEGQQATVAATRESGRRTRTTLLVIFVLVPVVLLVMAGLYALLSSAA